MTTIQTPQPIETTLTPPEVVSTTLAAPVLVLSSLEEPPEITTTLTPPAAVTTQLVVGQGPAGPSLTTETRTAAVPIIAYKALTTDDMGQVIYADAATATHGDQVLGISVTASLAGGMVMVQSMGSLTNTGWSWTPGQGVFLGLGGDLTQNPNVGAFCFSLGYAVTPTEIFIRLGRAIQRAL